MHQNIEGNIRFKRINHVWEKGKCKYCGASESNYLRSSDLETHAYELIHKTNVKEIFKMKFDVIVSNPPYQLSDGGNAASASPIYQYFVNQAIKLNPRYLTMIIPARWYAGGKGLDSFRADMLSKKHIKELYDIPNSADCFPGVNIAGGVCYFLWDKNYDGQCNVHNLTNGDVTTNEIRNLNEFDFFVRNNKALKIIRKVLKNNPKTMDQTVSSRNVFSLPTTIIGNTRKSTGDISVLTSKGILYVSPNTISDRNDLLQKYKTIITYAMSGGNKPGSDGKYQVLSSLQVLEPNEACSETYLVLDSFSSKEESYNLMTYASTKFFRFLLLQALTSIHITKDKFCFIPLQDFTQSWSDEKLNQKYNLNLDEIDLINSLIRDFSLNGGEE